MGGYYLCKEGLEGTTNGLQCIYIIGQIQVDFRVNFGVNFRVDFGVDFNVLILIFVGGPCTVSGGWLSRLGG